MPITVNDLLPLVYDPARAQQLILSNVKNHQINEPTNPFVMLLEASATLASASALETTATLKRMYPDLAVDTLDVLPHITDKELLNVFSYPADTSIVFYINVMELKANGIRNNALGYVETIVPSGTVITVTNIPFTLFNDISVKLYDTGVVFTEQLSSTDDAADNSLGILPSGIVNFQEGEPWVAIETTVKQVNKSVIIKTLTAAEGFDIKVKHTDKYYFSNVYYRDANTNNQWVKLVVSHSDTYINPTVPTATVIVLDNLVRITIPDVYLISGQVSGEVKIELYETLGYLNLPIYKYNMSEYKVDLNTVTSDPTKATINNITTYANSRGIVTGGKTGFTFEELRSSVINNTLGHEVLPVTTAQLAKTADLHGFELHKVIDVVTDRVFVASRNMEKYDSELVYSRPDVFFNTVGINISELSTSNIIIDPSYTLIPSGTVFRDDNGIVSIVPDIDLTYIASLTDIELIKYVQNNKLFFTPYYYIIDTTDTAIVNTRVYDLDNPEPRDIRITGKNVNIIERASVGKYGITKTGSGYEFIITILSNDEFNNTNINLLRGQLSISMYDGQSTLYLEGVYDASTKLMTFRIDSNFNLNKTDLLEITNGESGVIDNLISLVSKAEVILFTEDPVVTDNTNYMVDSVKLANATNVTVIGSESITLELGRPIDYIWNKLFSTYTDRKYLTHAVDKPLLYKEDVYEVDLLTGSIITIVTDPVTGVKSTTTTLLHAIGDPVLDANGLPVYEYRAGDVITDSNNLPTIDPVGGVVRNTDILMLEYEYKLATSLVSKNYLQTVIDSINGWLFTSLYSINAKVLENTKVLYRSYKRAEPVEILTESTKAKIPYTVKPVVNLYSSRSDYTSIELDIMKTAIGYILHNHLDGLDIDMGVIKKEIIDTVDNSIVSVKVDSIDSYRNGEVFKISNPITRLTLNKILSLNNSNELTVTYDIDMRVHKV